MARGGCLILSPPPQKKTKKSMVCVYVNCVYNQICGFCRFYSRVIHFKQNTTLYILLRKLTSKLESTSVCINAKTPFSFFVCFDGEKNIINNLSTLRSPINHNLIYWTGGMKCFVMLGWGEGGGYSWNYILFLMAVSIFLILCFTLIHSCSSVTVCIDTLDTNLDTVCIAPIASMY